MQSVVMRYYRINKIFMSQIGIWPYQSRIKRILIPSTIVLISFSILIAELQKTLQLSQYYGSFNTSYSDTSFSQIVCVFDTWGNVDIAIECMISTIVFIGCLTKLFNLILNIKETRYLFSLIEYHWQVFTNSTDIEIMQDYVTFSRKVVILYSIYVYTSMVLFMIIPMSPQIMDIVMPLNDTRPRMLLIEVEYRVDREKYYYPMLFHSYAAIVLIISIIVCVDTTYISYVEHGCSLFAAIGYRLEHVNSKGHIGKTSYFAKSKERTCQDVEVEDTCFKEKAIFYEFVTCLRKHQLAIQYVRILESSFTLSTAIQLLCNVIGTSLTGIQVINNLDSIENIIRYTTLCLASFFHLLCMTLPGQRLMDHSLNVFNSVSRSHWYTFSLKTKKVLRILLYRSIVPCTLTAGKLYVMSMANYRSVNIILRDGTLQNVVLVYDTWGNMDIMVEAIIVITVIIITCTKLINIIVNNHKFRRLLQLMCEHWEFFNSEFERHIMKYYASISQKVTKYFGVYFIIFTIFYLLIPLIPRILDVVKPLNESRPLIYVYSVEYRVDKEKYYYPILLHCYATTLITITIAFTVDTTYIMCVLHACSLFIAISHRLENITVKAETKSDNNKKYIGRHYHLLMEKHGSTGNDYRELIICLKRHQLALEYISVVYNNNLFNNNKQSTRIIFIARYVRILESSFTLSTAIQLLCNVIDISLTGIQVTNNLDSIENIIRYTALCLTSFFHLLCMTLPGQRLMDHSLNVNRCLAVSAKSAESVFTMSLINDTLCYHRKSGQYECMLTEEDSVSRNVFMYKNWSDFVFQIYIYFYCNLSIFCSVLVYDTWGNMDIIVEAITVITVIIGACTKLINIIVNNHKFRRLLQLMCEHWEFFNSEFERHIMKYYASISQKVTKYFGVYFIIFTIFYLLTPLIPRILDVVKPLNESRPLIYVYSVEYRVDKEKYYYPILLHCYATTLITITIAFTVDTTYIMCVLHACSLFIAIRYVQILNSTFTQAMFIILFLNMLNLSVIGIQLIENLENINEIIRSFFFICAVFLHFVCMCIPGQLLIDRSTKVFDKADGYCYSKKNIIAYMFKHVDDLDNMFELMPILAGTVICIAKITSLTCNSKMIIVRMGSSEIMRYIALMIMQSCRLFFNSWAGQEVTDHSVEVSIAAYDGIWYNASVKVQKLLLFLIARSQKASQITIAKLYVINLEGFSKVRTRKCIVCYNIETLVYPCN
ncbi:Odorant receptor 49b [Trachymyrmex cornetzi]|uniref:Odorant receptor 49b n=1 Tax=Trachymyrmex cornetzi TaxID=471704 RepID=A0A151JLM3_9HYME|nr:Odorant receptor 49b [Trachymyrmex cornetzi]